MIGAELRAITDEHAAVLLGVAPEIAARRPGPLRWSAQEIIGHLVDSAAVNHQRFVRSQVPEDFVPLAYAQDAWVRVQHYQNAPWTELVTLWREYNRHLARVMVAIPRVDADLEFLMHDYVEHLQHHLRQVRVLLGV